VDYAPDVVAAIQVEALSNVAVAFHSLAEEGLSVVWHRGEAIPRVSATSFRVYVKHKLRCCE